jgi:hypothetical protein
VGNLIIGCSGVTAMLTCSVRFNYVPCYLFRLFLTRRPWLLIKLEEAIGGPDISLSRCDISWTMERTLATSWCRGSPHCLLLCLRLACEAAHYTRLVTLITNGVSTVACTPMFQLRTEAVKYRGASWLRNMSVFFPRGDSHCTRGGGGGINCLGTVKLKL